MIAQSTDPAELKRIERGHYLYFRYHEGGKQSEIYPGRTDGPEGALKQRRTEKARSWGEMQEIWSWGNRVTVVVHHLPETEGFEGGYEAVTVMGVPHGVSVTGSDRESAKRALDHLLAGLKAFGFAGNVTVEDTTYVGGVQRYELAGG